MKKAELKYNMYTYILERCKNNMILYKEEKVGKELLLLIFLEIKGKR